MNSDLEDLALQYARDLRSVKLKFLFIHDCRLSGIENVGLDIIPIWATVNMTEIAKEYITFDRLVEEITQMPSLVELHICTLNAHNLQHRNIQESRECIFSMRIPNHREEAFISFTEGLRDILNEYFNNHC